MQVLFFITQVTFVIFHKSIIFLCVSVIPFLCFCYSISLQLIPRKLLECHFSNLSNNLLFLICPISYIQKDIPDKKAHMFLTVTLHDATSGPAQVISIVPTWGGFEWGPSNEVPWLLKRTGLIARLNAYTQKEPDVPHQLTSTWKSNYPANRLDVVCVFIFLSLVWAHRWKG